MNVVCMREKQVNCPVLFICVQKEREKRRKTFFYIYSNLWEKALLNTRTEKKRKHKKQNEPLWYHNELELPTMHWNVTEMKLGGTEWNRTHCGVILVPLQSLQFLPTSFQFILACSGSLQCLVNPSWGAFKSREWQTTDGEITQLYLKRDWNIVVLMCQSIPFLTSSSESVLAHGSVEWRKGK